MTNNTQLFIGFSGGLFGSNGVGKTTAANFLVEKYNFYLCNLSNPIEESAKKLCSWNGIKDKDGLQILNQVCISGKKINEDYWFNISLASIPKNINKIVFDNIYFSNETNFIKNFKGFVINIERNGFQKNFLTHKPDYVVLNNDSLDAFKNKIDKLIIQLYNIKDVINKKNKY